MLLLFLADENFPKASFEYLKGLGYDIKSILLDNASISDEEVIKISLKEDRIIVTFDSDFGELIFKTGYRPVGVIFFRWKAFRPMDPGKYIKEIIEEGNIELKGNFTVIDENQIRQRKI